jgi:DNA-binding CsgD family transcriptional regulator
LLDSFTRYFKREASSIIERAIREQINIRLIKGDAFFKVPDVPLARKDPKAEKFLNHIYPLSEREKQCLELFKEGKTAQMTGAILGLSQRTVEHYFDNIKNKLGCNSKTDLLLW